MKLPIHHIVEKVAPWVQPRDLQHGLELLEHVQQVRRLRVLALGRAYELAAQDRLYRAMGFHSLGGLAKDGLGTSKRNLERHPALVLLIDELPPVRQAVEQGLDLSRARMVADMACEQDVAEWLHVAKWTGVGEPRRAIKLVGSSKTVAHVLLDKYSQAIEAARGLVPGAEPIGIAPAVDEDATPGLTSLADRTPLSLFFSGHHSCGVGRFMAILGSHP